MNKVSLCQNS